MTDAEVAESHDALLAAGIYVANPDYWLGEITRRSTNRQAQVMTEQTAATAQLTREIANLTRRMVGLTYFIAAMAIVSTAFVIYSAVR